MISFTQTNDVISITVKHFGQRDFSFFLSFFLTKKDKNPSCNAEWVDFWIIS